MTPSNPDNNKPLIYRICDARGVFHLVAPFDHTHSQDEVEGLPAALNNKAPINHSHDSIGEDTGESYADVTASEGRVHIEVREVSEGGGECDITPSNIGNLARALETPDATPTANSDKLVTSGGVLNILQNFVVVKESGAFPITGKQSVLDSLNSIVENCAVAKTYPCLIECRRGAEPSIVADGFVRYNVIPSGTIYCYLTIGSKLMTATGTYSGTYGGDLGTITWGEAFTVSDVPYFFE